MAEQKHDRFKDAPWFSEEKVPILIGGAGGIGSWIAVLATRANFECHIYDFDQLEPINMAGQCFSHTDIGKSKIEALRNIVRLLCNEEINGYEEAITVDTMTNPIVITAFDNITARRIMFEKWRAEFRGNPQAIFIDGRLMAEQLTIYCILGSDLDAIVDYEKHLPDDSKIAEAPCTFKQVSHNAAMIAAKMVAFLTNFISICKGTDPSRAVPYFKEYMTALDWEKKLAKAPKREEEPEPTHKKFSDRMRDLGIIKDETKGAEVTLDLNALPPMSLEETERLMHQQGLVLVEDSESDVAIINPIGEVAEVARFNNENYPNVQLSVTTMTPSEVIERFGQEMTEEQRSVIITGTSGEMELGEQAQAMFHQPATPTPPSPEEELPF